MTEVKDIDREAAVPFMGSAVHYGALDEHRMVQAFAAHREAAEKAERDRIVAWLRAMQEGRTSDNYPGYFALRIERGEHLPVIACKMGEGE